MARPELSIGLQMTLHQLGVGSDRVWMRARGHGPLSSVEVLRSVMARIAEATGDGDFNNLVDDALRAECARGVRGTVDLIRGNKTRVAEYVDAMQAMAFTTGGEDPNYAEEAREVARRSEAYQELAVRELLVTSDEDMEQTVGGTD